MANIRGIELASEIYDLEDTSARNTATSASQTATEAGQTATQASQTATQASQTATQASQTATQADEKATENASAISQLQSDMETLEDDALTPKGLNTMQITMAQGYSSNLAVIDQIVKVGRVMTCSVTLNGIRGGEIGSDETAEIGTCPIHPIKTVSAMGYDILSKVTIRARIDTEGTFYIEESEGVTSGSNVITIPFTIIV